MNNIVTKLNENSGYSTTKMEYPSIEILQITDALAVLMSCLKQGDIPVYMEHNGNMHRLKMGLDPDPMNLRLLLRIYSIKVNITEHENVIVKSTTELLDLGKWW